MDCNEIEVDKYDEDELEDLYKDQLDDLYGTIEIAGITFDASIILEECDPVAYETGLSDAEYSLQETETVYECRVCGSRHDDSRYAEVCCIEE